MEKGSGTKDRPFFDLLPELYREDRDLDALLTVFERCHLNLERFIEQMPEYLYNPVTMPAALLDFVGATLGLRNENQQFTPAQMRELLPDAFWLHRRKGTRVALEYLLERYLHLLCGHSVRFWITEPGEAGEPSPADGEMPQVTVHIICPPELEHDAEKIRLNMLVQNYTPAPVRCRVVYEEKRSLGGVYLGYSTRLY